VTDVRIDHVIYATRDLDRAAAMVEGQLGLSAVAGGRHEGVGTHNMIVPLGNGYLELLAVCDEEEAARSAVGSALKARIEELGDGLMGWAVAVDDVQSEAERLGTWVTPISREGLTAQLTGFLESLREPFLPFFIARDPEVPDPGHGADSTAGGITWIEVVGDPARLTRWLRGAELPVRITEGAPAVVAVGVGDRELRTR
jgi:catechol 2,3-dioxygenase-like lactoylglutathione lyase family enzyme